MNNHHKIQKQVIEVTTSDPSAGIGFEREVRDVYAERLLPRMESLFDQYSGGQNRIRIDTLEINITLPLSKSWQDNFCDVVLRELEAGLRSAVRQDAGSPEVPGSVVEDRGDEEEAFFYFLANGTLPWYADWRTLPEMKEWLRRVSGGAALSKGSRYEPGSFFNRVVRLMAGDKQAVHRWMQQFGDDSLEKIFSDTPEYKIVMRWASRLSFFSGAGKAPARWAVIFSFLDRRSGVGALKGPPDQMEAEVFRMLWGRVPEKVRNAWWKEECPDEVKSEIAVLLRGAELRELEIPEWMPESGGPGETSNDPDIHGHQKKIESRRRREEEGIFIDNAGLVLLHPFLAPLFTSLEWWDGSRFASPELHRRAVLLTQYMVYPGEEFPEHQLVLNKVLCGYEPEETLPSGLICSEREIDETNELLAAVIGHWTMNGRAVFTTVENLRGSFLQRTGKLSRRSSGDWLMQVEGKGYDIVLNSLPWGIGLIRHPWMPDMLRVEWGQ